VQAIIETSGLMQNKRELFSSIINENYPRVVRLCMRYFGNREEAEDAAQDVFEKVWMNIERFRGESSVNTWVFRIATNVCLTTLRRRKNSPVRLEGIKAESSDED
jgi:RNA polymerase sigma-70 factor (ECF subfamily)